MGDRELHFRAQKRIWDDSIAIYLLDKSIPDRLGIVTDYIFTALKPGQMYPETPLRVSITAAQELMDNLWECGLRPSEGSGSAGALLATQSHLKDMQSLSWRLLTMIENEK
jgi:hypothetical protein